MGASTQEYLKKADLAVADLTSSGGLLLPEQAKEFIEIVIDENVLMPMLTVKPMAGPTMELSKIGFSSTVLRGATERQALGDADRVKPDLGKVNLVTKLFKGEARISYETVEDNIVNGTFQDLVMREMAKAVARDIENVVINGDTTSTDPLLSPLDGLLKQATTLVINAGGVRLTKGVLKQTIQTLPSRFMRSQKNLGFITSKNATIDYVDSLANRATPLGDSKLVSAAAGEYMSYPVIPIPLFPENLGGGTNMTSLLFFDPKNVVVGIQREIRVETDRDISAGDFKIVVTVRFDVKYIHEPALVKVTNILASPAA